ncbi:hypothetical protein PAPYR_1594 [Paratrimastix pyriformis]|uniref:F-box domain-containing protein n=1 Tax=Paratrimastix pyriformis TaxID=342808 RepID=A0ABQ8UU66_9EUKA|nr:hypothetical protein PAPYR_1594 [Paratrimastix pyriformis]
MLENLPIDLLQNLIAMSSDWPLETYCQFIGLSRTLRKKIRGTLHEIDFECPREDLNDDGPTTTPDSQRYAPVLRPATLVALLAPCQNTLRSLALPSGRSLTGCGRAEVSFAGWVDAAFGGGLGGTLRSLTIRSLEGLSSVALHRMLGHLPGLEHFCCPELVDLTLGAADLGSLNPVLPRLPCLQTLRVLYPTCITSPASLNLSLLPHPERLRALTPPPYTATHIELLTGLEELVGCSLEDRIIAALVPTLRRVTIPQAWVRSHITAIPQAAIEFRGPASRCPQATWAHLERATVCVTADDVFTKEELSIVAPRLQHLVATHDGPGPAVTFPRRLEAPLLESLEIRVEYEIGKIELKCPMLRSLTLCEVASVPPLLWRCSDERFDRLQTLNIKRIWRRSCPILNLATARAAFGLVPNLTTLKGIALTDPAHLPILADLCSGALLPHLAHLDAVTTTRPKGLRLPCSPSLRVLTLHLENPLPRHILRIVGPGLVRLQVEATRMPPLAIEAPRLRCCRLAARSYQPTVHLAAPALRWLSFECHNDNLSALVAVLACLPALTQLRLVVPWLPAVVPQILTTAIRSSTWTSCWWLLPDGDPGGLGQRFPPPTGIPAGCRIATRF